MATVWKDIDITLERQQNGDVRAWKNEDAIKSSLSNIFQTIQGQRRMLPEFALPIHNLLFEPIDSTTAQNIGYLLLDAIETWEDRVIVENIHVNARPDMNQYTIRMDFRIKSSDTIETMEQILFAK